MIECDDLVLTPFGLHRHNVDSENIADYSGINCSTAKVFSWSRQPTTLVVRSPLL